MLGQKKFQPKIIYNISLEGLVPPDDFYRRLESLLDLRFVYQECKNLYGKTGNPSIDPVVFFKLNIFGFFENIISDRDLIRKANDRLSIRYFLGYDIDEKLPWHSTISRTRSLIKKEVFEKIFEMVLERCNDAGLIEGKHQSIDSTLVKANASMDSLERKEPVLTVKEFINKSYEENQDDREKVKKEEKAEDNIDDKGNKSPELTIEKKCKRDQEIISHQKKDRNKKYYSKTDPDSRVATKPGTPVGLYYLTHYASDSKFRVITDVLTIYADIKDSRELINVYERSAERLNKLGLTIEEVSADKGYCSGSNLRTLEQCGVTPFIPSAEHHSKGFPVDDFIYNEEEDAFTCPQNKRLKFSTLDKDAKRYCAKIKDCQGCPLKEQCCPDTKMKIINRTIYYKEYDRLKKRMRTWAARKAKIIRQTVAESLFAEAKGNHGLRKFMTLGVDNAQKKSYLIATVQNLKRLMKEIGKRQKRGPQLNRNLKKRELLNFIIPSFSGELNLN
jgi:transposase